MNKNVIPALCFTAALFIVLIIIKLISSRRKEKVQFDERQQLARSQAFKHGFSSVMLYSIICIFFGLFEVNWAPVYVQFGLALIIGFLTFALTCIFKDAYMGFNYRKNIFVYSFSCIVLGVLHLIIYISHLQKGEATLFTSGTLSDHALYLFSAITFITIGVSLIIKKVIDSKASED